jgi:hypothetical protein
VKDLAPRRLTAILAALAALATLYAVQARPAAAHDDDGQMTVTVAEPAGPDQVRVEVGLVYTGDGHLAEEAVVSATLNRADGQVVGPVDLARASGSLYGAEIAVPGPGAWQVAVTSTNPTATAEAVVDVAAPPDESPPSASPDATTSPDATAPGPTTAVASPPATAPDDDDRARVGLVAIVVVVILAAGAGYWWYRRRSSAAPAD